MLAWFLARSRRRPVPAFIRRGNSRVGGFHKKRLARVEYVWGGGRPAKSAKHNLHPAVVTRPPCVHIIESANLNLRGKIMRSEYKVELARGTRWGLLRCVECRNVAAGRWQLRGPWQSLSPTRRLGANERQADCLESFKDGFVAMCPILAATVAIAVEAVEVSGSDDAMPMLATHEG